MYRNNKLNIDVIAIFIGSILIFSIGLGQVHLFDWDEINFAENAREMLVSGDYLTVSIDYKAFWEKPPLFIWSQVLSMKIFGVNEFAARFPNAFIGAWVLVFLFYAGNKLQDKKFARLWVLAYIGSLLPFFYFKSGIIDPWFNFFIFLGLYFFMRYFWSEGKYKNLILSAFFVGLSVLTKGPVGFLIFFLTVIIFLSVKSFKVKIRFIELIVFSAILLFVGGFWYILLILNGKFDLIVDFVEYQIRLLQTKDAGHGGFLFYHFVVLFLGVFPASIFALRSFFGFKESDKKMLDFTLLMKILFWTVLILFTIVKTKIVHYSSMCYYPISYLVARVIYRLTEENLSWQKVYNFLLFFVALILGLLVFSLPLVEVFKDKIINSGIIKDTFAIGALQAKVSWSPLVYFIGILMILISVVSLVFNNIRHNYIGAKMIFVGTLFFTFSTMMLIVPKIEEYSQKSMIEFYQEKSKEKCYAESFFKSYARLFYFDKKPWQSGYSCEELMQKKLEIPVYFVAKISQKQKLLDKYPQIRVLYEKNGYVFFVKR